MYPLMTRGVIEPQSVALRLVGRLERRGWRTTVRSVTQVPVPAGGDGCEGGTFYLDSPLGGVAQMETNMLELMAFIDANYRTKNEEMVEIIK